MPRKPSFLAFVKIAIFGTLLASICSSIELFANDGAAVATHFALPDPQNRSISLSGKGNATVSMVINELKSSWPEK